MFHFTGKSAITFQRSLISFFIFSCLVSNGFAQQTAVQEEAIVQNFYLQTHQQLFWFSSDENVKKATEWLLIIESAGHLGIVSDQLQSDQIRVTLLSNNSLDNLSIKSRETGKLPALC